MDNQKPWRNGGKGKKAPYETSFVRCPKPIKDDILSLIKSWHCQNFKNQFTAENASLAISLINEYAETRKINWNSPRTEGLLKFLNWLENKAQTKVKI